jgi:hypothetical protein
MNMAAALRLLGVGMLACACAALAQAPTRQQVLGADRALWATAKTVSAQPREAPSYWTGVSDPVARISLAFPCVPRQELVRAPLAITRGQCGAGNLYYVAFYGPQIFSDPFDPDAFHAGTDFGLLLELDQAGLRATAVPEMRLTYLGLHGRQVRIESEKIHIRKRTLVRKDFSIQMQVSGPPGSLDDSAERFFDSLRIGD